MKRAYKLAAKRIADRKIAAINRRSVPYEPGLLERLKDLNYAADYLSNCINADGDETEMEEEFAIFFSALEKIVKAQGLQDVADRMDAKRDTIYRMFSHKNPSARNLIRLLNALGLDFEIVPKRATSAKRA